MKVFISFSSADKKIAEKIYDRLKKHGIDCWICTKDIPPGADFQSCIVEAINKAAVVVLVFSSNANASAEIAKELSLASKKIVIPARIEDVVPQGSFQYQLSNRQFVDLFDDFDKNLDQIAYQIQTLVGNASNATPPKKQYKVTRLVKKFGIPTALGLVAITLGSWFFIFNKSFVAKPEKETPQATSQSSTKNIPQITLTPSATDTPQVDQNKTIASPSITLSDKVNNLMPILNNTSDNSRLSALKTMKPQLPSNLNYLEAEMLLKNSNGYRSDAIKEIAEHLNAGLNGSEAATILGTLADSNRLSGIRSLLQNQKIKPNLNHKDADALLLNTNGYRSDALREIAGLMAINLTGVEAAEILDSMTDSGRLNGIKSLLQNQKIKTNLNYRDAEALLLNTNGYRADAIKEISSLLANNLKGSEISLILGSLSGFARLQGIKSIIQNNKINTNLNASEVEAILMNIENYKVDALKALAPFIKI